MSRLSLALILSSAALALGACHGPPGLNISGNVVVDAGSHTTGFPFPSATRLDGTGVGENGVTGTCELSLLDSETVEWGVVVDLQRGVTDDNGLAGITIMQRTDGDPTDGRVDLVLGTTQYSSLADGSCAVGVDYVDGDGVVQLSGTCPVNEPGGESAEAVFDVDLFGCTVIR